MSHKLKNHDTPALSHQNTHKLEHLHSDASLPALSPGGSVDAYLRVLSQIPLLTPQEEQKLLLEYKEGNIDSAKRLVLSNLRFVVFIAKKYIGYGLPREEIIQEGTLGLMKAIRRFDPERGTRLISFAVYWIKDEIHRYVLSNAKLLKTATTKVQRKLFWRLRQLKKDTAWMDKAEAQRIAQTLNVPLKDVYEMERRLTAPEVSLDSTLPNQSESSKTYGDVLADESHLSNPEHAYEAQHETQSQSQKLHEALNNLDNRSRVVVEKRFLSEEKTTLKALAEHLDVSIERVRQIEKSALGKLKGFMHA